MVTGEVVGAIGMSEPGAGSDLQGMKTSALKDGDDFVINDQKPLSPTASMPMSLCSPPRRIEAWCQRHDAADGGLPPTGI